MAKQKGQSVVACGLNLPIYVKGKDSISVLVRDSATNAIIYKTSAVLENGVDTWLCGIKLEFAQSIDIPTNKVLGLQVDYGGIIICDGKVFNISPKQAARIGLMLELEKMEGKEGEMHQYIVIKRTVIREAYEVTAPSEGDAIELVKQGQGERAPEYDSSQDSGYEIA